MIRQFTYTASPWGKTGAGWMVFQQSRDVPAETTKALYPIYNYAGESAADGADHPVQFAYLPSETGDGAVLAQTTFTGTRWFDPRPGDFFAHVLLLDKDGVGKSAAAGTNPMRLFRGDGLQSEFPEALKEKALKIFQKDIAWEPPPELPTLNSLADVRGNPALAFGTALRSIPTKSVAKLGAVLRSMLLRASGKSAEAVVFDGRNNATLALMAVALDLFPPTWRSRTWFAVQFRESALRRLPSFPSLTFYGTDAARSSDPDTGIVSGVCFSQDPFRFRNHDDVVRFKRQLDLLGGDVSFDDYKGLVSCWEVAAGRKADVAALRAAARFAKKFPGLKEEVAKGFAGALADYNYHELPRAFRLAGIVAGFELGMRGANIPGELNDCARDGTLFADALRTLDGDGSRKAFADAVATDAESNGATAELAAMWLGCPPDVRALLARNVTGPFVSLAALADRFDAIRRDVAADGVARGLAAGLLDEADRAAKRFGDGFDGMEETRNALRYLVALDGLNGIEGLSAFARAVRGLGVDEEKVRTDVLDRVKPGDIPVERLAGDLDAFEVVGIPKEVLLRLVVETAERRGRDEGERSGRQRTRSAQPHADAVASRRGLPPWIAAAVGVMALAIGLASGYFFGSSRVPAKAAGTENRELLPPPPAPKAQETDLPTVQHDDSSVLSAPSPQSLLDEPLQLPQTFPPQSQQTTSLDLPQVPEPDSPQQSQQESSASRSTMAILNRGTERRIDDEKHDAEVD